jgi:hypothetical protein
MTPRAFTAGWLVSAALLSSWAVSSAGDQARPGRAPAPAPGGLPPLALELDAEVARLATRTHDVTPARMPARNPFAFTDRRAEQPRTPEPGTAQRPQLVAAAPADIPAPAPSLSGVADTGGALTAVISFLGDLHFVRKGDVIAERYRVDAVRLDGVDIFDLALGTVLRLSLQL